MPIMTLLNIFPTSCDIIFSSTRQAKSGFTSQKRSTQPFIDFALKKGGWKLKICWKFYVIIILFLRDAFNCSDVFFCLAKFAARFYFYCFTAVAGFNFFLRARFVRPLNIINFTKGKFLEALWLLVQRTKIKTDLSAAKSSSLFI